MVDLVELVLVGRGAPVLGWCGDEAERSGALLLGRAEDAGVEGTERHAAAVVLEALLQRGQRDEVVVPGLELADALEGRLAQGEVVAVRHHDDPR